jgi:group I intron endonuclease
MWIYKITNIQNNKIYIGQTIRPIEQRFHRHINDALNNILDTHFARAIRKYGKNSFIIEEIDSAQTQDELNKKEQYWIQYYNSVEDGYNETDAISKCGGNTYQSKTEEEMEIIKEKIRQTKLGSKNPMARKIKRTNIITNEIDIFCTIISCAQACGIKNGKTSITTRLNGKVKSPFKGQWIFEYYDE